MQYDLLDNFEDPGWVDTLIRDCNRRGEIGAGPDWKAAGSGIVLYGFYRRMF